MLRMGCPSCEKRLRVPDDTAGRRIKCPSCGHTFVGSAAPSKGDADADRQPAAARIAAAPAAKADIGGAPAERPVRLIRRTAAPDTDEDDPILEASQPAQRVGRKTSEDEPRPASTATIATAIAVPVIGAVAGMVLVALNWKDGATERLLGPLFIGLGLFAVIVAVLNWHWYMELFAQRATQYVNRTGLRILYVGAGLLIVVMGALGALGVIDLRRR